MKIKLFLGLLAGLAPLAWPAGLEDLRSAQLADMNAGRVQEMELARFPQPELVKLDMCVLSEMKNDRCYFKCESGAVTTEPAVRPDFSAGEPVGPCAPYITRQIKVFADAGKNSGRASARELFFDQTCLLFNCPER